MRTEKGFTLIELLIVVGILAALAAIVIPNVSKFFGAGRSESVNIELQNVQAGMDLLMSDHNSPSVKPLAAGSATTDMTTPVTLSATPAAGLSPDYLRSATTKCNYYWSGTGQVSRAASVACPTPAP